MSALGVLLIVLGLLIMVMNGPYTLWWLGPYRDRVRRRDILWLRVGAVVSGMGMTVAGVIFIANGQ